MKFHGHIVLNIDNPFVFHTLLVILITSTFMLVAIYYSKHFFSKPFCFKKCAQGIY